MLPLIGRIADLRGRVPVLVGGAGGVRRSARWSPRWPTTCPAWWSAGSSRASAAAGWCRRRSPWSPTSTRPTAAASRSASSRRSRSSAASSARCTARWCSRSPTGGRSSRSTSPSGWSSPPPSGPAARPRAARADRTVRSRPPRRPSRRDLGLGRAAAPRWSALAAGALVVLRADARWSSTSRWGQLFIPVDRRRAAGSPRSGSSRSCAAVLFLVRCWHRRASAGRPARLVGRRPRGRPARRAVPGAALGGVILAFATADPRVQVFSPQGWWYLLGAAWSPRSFVWHLRTDGAPAGPARRAASYAGLGRAAGQLLRRRGPDRGAHRHPDLRPDHRLPRLAAAGRPGAGPLPGGAAGRRRRRRLPDPHRVRRRGRGRRDGAGRARRSC